MTACPLCKNQENHQPIHSNGREFLRCRQCELIFTTPDNLPTSVKEKRRYENHHNTIADSGYVEFLNQALQPAFDYLKAGCRIMDYGCGPGPVLSQLLKLKDYDCDNYDPFFFPEMPSKEYDCIFSTETFEHFHQPGTEIERLKALLKPSGILVVMTEFYQSTENFQSWWYTRDFTHVSFYNENTFRHIGQHFGFRQLHCDGQRVVILQKNGA